VAGLAGEGVGKEEGLTGARFVAGDEAGKRPAAARGGGRRCLPLELLLRWRGGAGGGVQRHGEVVWGRAKLLGRLVDGGKAGISELTVGHRWRAARRPAHGQRAAFIAGRLSTFTTKGTRPP
jgi:hypothetical protein